MPRPAVIAALAVALALPGAATAVAQNAPPTTPPSKPAAKPDAAPEIPGGRELLARALEVVGGREAFADARTKGYRIAIRTVSGPRPVDMTVTGIGPSRMKLVQPIPQLGMEIVMGLDGDAAWADVPIQGRQRVDPVDLASGTELARLPFVALDLVDRWTPGAVTESRMGGRPTWAIVVDEKPEFALVPDPNDPPSGAPNAAPPGPRTGIVHVDRATGRIVAVAAPRNDRGRAPRTFVIEAWSEGDAPTYPTKIREQGTPRPRSIEIRSFEFVEVDPAEVSLPDDLRDDEGDGGDATPGGSGNAGGGGA